MRFESLVLVLTAGLGGIAAAQPGPPPQPPPPPVDTGVTAPTEPGPPEPQPPQPQPPPPQPQPVVREEAPSSDRPEGVSVALGIGYDLPTSLETPNRTSLRLRLAGGLTFEPFVTIANTSEDMDTPTMQATNKETEFALGALGRLPVVTHNKVDLEALATAAFRTNKNNPEGDYNTRTTNSFAIGWGVGVGYWLSRHWQFSMSVTNPIISYDSTKQQTGPGMSTTNGETTIGVIFLPDVFMMIHLYN